jgi:hypothetical protein
MPEHGFVYTVVKELAGHAREIFEAPEIRWEVNKDIGSGKTDLVISFGEETAKNIAFEFKIGSHSGEAFINDIQKLSKLSDLEYNRIFCALQAASAEELLRQPSITAVGEIKGEAFRAEEIDPPFDFFTRYIPGRFAVSWHYGKSFQPVQNRSFGSRSYPRFIKGR